MRTEDIFPYTIDEAAEEILRVLKEKTHTTRTVSSRDNVFYFDGWDGLGASAVLRAIAQRLATTSADGKRALDELGVDQVIHIDCSMWESRRALQRAVAEQLNLPSQVMELFDTEDEKDDFCGVALGSRAEVQQIVREMQQHIQKQNRRFLVVFHNGGSEEIDLASCCGFLLSGFSTSKVLWTFQGRFRLKPRREVDNTMETGRAMTDAFISAVSGRGEEQFPPELWSYLVQKEASEVAEACKINTGPGRNIIDRPTQVAECFMYMLGLCCRGRHSVNYDWATHGANYWICDGIIQQQGQGDREAGAEGDEDGSWRAADALQSEMALDVDYHQYLPSSHLARFVESKPSWVSPNYGFNHIPAGAIPNGDIFQHYAGKLCVLKLSRCTFDFQAPPFLCCHSLRFLWLDHCQGTNKTSTYGAGMEEDIRRCFQRLWVLDVRDTDCDQILSAQMLDLMTQLRELHVIGAKGWDMGQLQGRLPNIRKLRVNNSGVSCSCPENDLFSEMNMMEHLEFSGNYSPGDSSPMTSLFGPRVSNSNASCLETLVVDGCRLQQISFRGCTGLKNLHLGGKMWYLHTLDISGTAVKTLDLSSTTTVYYLDELYLLDCKKLRAILWPKEQMKQGGLGKLFIDTTWSAPTVQSREEKSKRDTSTAITGTSVAPAAAPHPHGNQPSSEFDWHISVRDARLLGSLEPVYSYSRRAYVEISPRHPTVDGGESKGIFKSTSSREQQLLVNLQRQPTRAHAVYTDISADHLQQASKGGDDTLGIMWMWPCPDVPDLLKKKFYMHIQDQIKTKLSRGGEETSAITVPEFVQECAKILHVHDSISITRITSDQYDRSEWPDLEWCRIERCPKLDFVFYNVVGNVFNYQLRIFWASQLLKSCYISTSYGGRLFPCLMLLHLDLCPRLVHALPLTWNFGNDKESLRLLETLEIAWCGDLIEIFPFKTTPKPNSKEFPKLKHIHLHELPSLQHICGVRMSTPNLETLKIRGCWSLRRLPATGSSNKVVECDCEKEWWDRLEWDDRSQADNYRPIHPRYYKKTMLRGSVLR